MYPRLCVRRSCRLFCAVALLLLTVIPALAQTADDVLITNVSLGSTTLTVFATDDFLLNNKGLVYTIRDIVDFCGPPGCIPRMDCDVWVQIERGEHEAAALGLPREETVASMDAVHAELARVCHGTLSPDTDPHQRAIHVTATASLFERVPALSETDDLLGCESYEAPVPGVPVIDVLRPWDADPRPWKSFEAATSTACCSWWPEPLPSCNNGEFGGFCLQSNPPICHQLASDTYQRCCECA